MAPPVIAPPTPARRAVGPAALTRVTASVTPNRSPRVLTGAGFGNGSAGGIPGVGVPPPLESNMPFIEMPELLPRTATPPAALGVGGVPGVGVPLPLALGSRKLMPDWLPLLLLALD